MSRRPALNLSPRVRVPGLQPGGQSCTRPHAPLWRTRLPSEPLTPDAG